MNDTAEVTNLGTVNVSAIKESLPELRALRQAKIDAAESFSDAAKGAAEKAGCRPDVLKAYVTALVKDKEQDFAEKCGQMDMLAEL